jgi:hypothetical protein
MIRIAGGPFRVVPSRDPEAFTRFPIAEPGVARVA